MGFCFGRHPDKFRPARHNGKKAVPQITTRRLDKLMYNKTKLLALNTRLLLAICLVSAVPSFAASIKGTSPAGNEVVVEIKKTPSLKYPRPAERLGVEGFVTVGFDLSAEGELIDLRVIESQPRLMFDKSALKFVKGMDFDVPEEDGNRIMTSDIKFRVQFQLRK